MARPIAVSAREEEVYVLEDNRADPETDQVRFRLKRSLPFGVRKKILDAFATDGESITPAIGTRYILACQYGLKGWENFQDADGKDVPCNFKGGVVSESSLSHLEDSWIIELGQHILSGSTLEPAQVGE